MRWLKNNKLIVLGVFIGALGGYLYYRFVGCASGTCAITSSPINSTLYFAFVGGLMMNIVKPNSDKQKNID